MVNSRTRAFGSPAKYIQGAGEFDSMEKHTSAYGKKALFVVDGFLFDSFGKRLEDIYSKSDSSCQVLKFEGECCPEEIERLSEAAKSCGADVVAGVGGGKTMDTVKIVANDLELPLIIVPTSASTDAPTAALSVLYTKDGEYIRNIKHKKHADLILMDSEIVAKAPVRLFVAGMGDALATYVEAMANERSDSANFIGQGYRRTKASMAIAKTCYDVLMEDGIQAKIAVEKGLVTEAVENVIEANTLLSGLGYENTGLSCAHGIHSGLTALSETHHYYHGEKVAFGILCELVLENAPKEFIDEIMLFMLEIGLPCTLSDLGVEATPENVSKIAYKTTQENKLIYSEPFVVTEKSVYDAILAADALGNHYKEILA